MKIFLKKYLQKPEVAGIVLFILLTALFQYRSGGIFLSVENMRGVLGILPETALVAIGVTILMIGGEFDLSVGSVFALTPMSIALLMGAGLPFALAILGGLVIAAIVGYVNGWLTLRFDIPSFITTLGMMYVARSLTIVISGGFPPPLAADLPKWVFTLYVGPYGIFRMSFLWFLAIAFLGSAMLSYTNLGNWIRATGGFSEAARSLGVPTRNVKLFSFILCSVLAGFAGLIQTMRLGSPLPSAGDGMELQAVAAAVIGGTALTGGIGTVLGGIVGALLIRVIDNGMVLTRVDANWFKFAVGGLTILAVIVNAWMRRTGQRIKVEDVK
jgi:simple sugar transport system permease protein